ncbi:MAG: AAA family ATPase [Candidatus Heimdallarchaeota archaeon]|nr:AAA family ATPase [Candidatus Heimdallarchaeota archaeon]
MSNKSSKIIMIHSYKGGTGKTSIAINLARYFARKQEKKVLLIEQDTGGPSFSNIFQTKPKKYWNDFYSKQKPLKDLIIPLDHFDTIFATAEEIKMPRGESPKTFYTRQLERLNYQKKWLKRNYDFVILDTRPGYTIELLNSIMIADLAILIARIDSDTVKKTIKMYNQVYSQFKSKSIILVQNQVPSPVPKYSNEQLDLDIENALKTWESFTSDKQLITIPLKNEIAYLLSRSKLVPLDSLFMDYIQEITELIEENSS